MTHRVTIRYGHMAFKTRSCRVIAFALDDKGTKGSCPPHTKLRKVGDAGTIMSNGTDSSNGQWFGSTFDADEDKGEGTVIILKHIQKFGASVICTSVLPIRIRETGPLLLIKGRFPVVKGFAHATDLMLFSGRADILTRDELEDLGLESCLSDNDWDYGFEEDDVETCYNITTTTTNLSGYQERPEFVTVDTGDGEKAGIAVPKPFARRVRVKAPPKKPAQTTRRRRRRS